MYAYCNQRICPKSLSKVMSTTRWPLRKVVWDKYLVFNEFPHNDNTPVNIMKVTENIVTCAKKCIPPFLYCMQYVPPHFS